MTNPAVVSTNNQPKLFSSQPRVLVVVSPMALGASAPHSTKASTAAAATPNTTLSSGSGWCARSRGSGSAPVLGLLAVWVTTQPFGQEPDNESHTGPPEPTLSMVLRGCATRNEVLVAQQRGCRYGR